jgi:pimeloyl-ACP methyl ester carboxylesterase
MEAPATGPTAGMYVVELEAHRDLDASDPRRGVPDSLPVVLIHGSLDRSTSFLRTTRRLEDRLAVIYDRRGYARSRGVEPIATGIDMMVTDLLGVIRGREVAVVGHSFGGLIALCAAEREPNLIKAVGAFEPPLPWYEWWPNRSRSSFVTEDPHDYARGFFERMAGEGSWERLNESGKDARRADGPALVAELAAIRTGDPLVDLEHLEVPVVAGRGSKSADRHRRSAQVVAETVPNGQLFEIEGSGHGAHLSHPDAFANFVRIVLGSAR